MSVAAFQKVVSVLPATLAADTLYAVRVGVGFDLYISDSTGTVAHKVNGGDGGGSALSFSHVLASEVEVTSTTFQDVPGLGQAILADERYLWWFEGHYSTTTTLLHAEIGINGPASPNNFNANLSQGAYASTLVAIDFAAITSYDQVFSIVYGTNNYASPFGIGGYIDNGSNAGTLIPRLASEAGDVVKILPGSRFYGIKL